MRNKPRKLFILMNSDNEPYRIAGKVKAYNSKGRGVKQAKKLYESRSLLYRVVRCELTTASTEVTA